MQKAAVSLSPEELRQIELYEASEKVWKKIQTDPLWWSRNYTKTFDQKWQEHRLKSAYNYFPDYQYLDILFDFLQVRPKFIPTKNTKVRFVPKARDLLISWSLMVKLTHLAQNSESQEIVIQSKQKEMGEYLIDYVKMLWNNQPDWLKDKYPLAFGMKLDDFAKDNLAWANGSKIIAIPQGEAKLNTMHPSILFMDEGAFHEEGLGAYNSGMAAASFIIVVSSAWPGWFHDLVGEDRFPIHGKKISKGIAYTETARGAPVLWFDCSAHPHRDAEWEEREKPNYTSDSEFARQQHIDFTAGGGEKVLRERLEARWEDIVITDPEWRPHSENSYVAGLDYGKSHYTAFEVLAKDRDGVITAVQEHYQSGLEPGIHADIIRQMRIPCRDNPLTIAKVSRTWSDPSLFPDSVAGEEKFTSIQQLFEKHGSLKMQSGIRGSHKMDLYMLDLLLSMWPKVGPIRFKIWCPEMVARLTPGTFQHGCPNLLWELLNLKRKQISPTMIEKKGNPEGLVDNKNDAWDVLKYIFTAGEIDDVIPTKEERWQNRKAELLKRNPELDTNSMIIYRKRFERDEAKVEVRAWR